MIQFDKKTVLKLHDLIIETSGGKTGVKDFNLLESALKNSFQTFDGIELYPTKLEKGARLGYSLISNHSFVDGNKRIGILVMLTFLKLNNIDITYTDDDLIKIGLAVASGEMSYNDLVAWVKSHQKNIELNPVL